MKKIFLPLLIITAGASVYYLFETPFAENSIDYFSFFVGLFLVIEASYEIIKTPEKPLLVQTFRLARIILGTCIFTIHYLEFIDKL